VGPVSRIVGGYALDLAVSYDSFLIIQLAILTTTSSLLNVSIKCYR
jgi:hypothetical protein